MLGSRLSMCSDIRELGPLRVNRRPRQSIGC